MSQWKSVALGDLAASVDYGLTASATEQPIGPKFLRITDIQDDSVNWNSVPWCECDVTSADASRLQAGDIVFARTGATTGKSFLIRNCPPNTVFASYLIRVRVGDNVEPRFISHFFQTREYWAQITKSARGVAQPGVNASTLKTLKVPLPPLPEQRRIAEILDRVEALRAKRSAALAQLDTLTQSIFLDLFGDPKLNERNWPVAKMGAVISDLRGGANLAPDDFVEDGFPILHKGAIKQNGAVALDAKKKTFATPKYAATNRRCQIDRNYLAVTLRDLVPTGPSIGLIANLQDGPFDAYLLAQGAYGFLVDSGKVTAEYLVFLSNMPTFRHVLRKYAVGSTQIHIRTPVYLDIPIPVPPLSIQQQFSLRVAAVRGLRERLVSSMDELNVLFGSLQTRAFVGGL